MERYSTEGRQATATSRSVSLRSLKRTKWFQRKLFKLAKAFILLFMNTSSIHGFSQITTKKRHPIESCVVLIWLGFNCYSSFNFAIQVSSVFKFPCVVRRCRHFPKKPFVWIIAISAAVWGSVKVSLSTFQRYQSSPTVVSIERNYHDWNTTFPALAICPTAVYSEQAISQVLERYPNVKDRSAFSQFFKELVNGSYLDWKDKLKTPFKEVDPKEFWKIAYDIRWKFKYNVSNSNMDHFNVVNLRLFMTDAGICYSYNSLASPYSERWYWESKNWTFISEEIPFFEGNPLDGDIFAQVMNMNTGYKLFLLDPYEVPDVATKYHLASNDSYKTLDINAVSIVSDDTLKRDLTISQRKCRFPTESNLLTSPAYSYHRCRQECRMKLSVELCGCVAYFYRPTKGFPYCDFEGYRCLGEHGSLIHFLADENEKKVECNCLPLCSETTYVAGVDNTMAWKLGTNLKWGMVRYPKLRYKRGIIFGMSDLIVAIGGTAGLFLGCSLLSFAEIFYFFTVRLVLFLIRRNFR